MFDNLRSDFRAHGCSIGAQGFWALSIYRFGRWRYTIRPVLLRKLFSLVYKVAFKLVQVATGIELPCEAQIGHNFVIDHFGSIIVHGGARLGDDCRIRTGVVIGLRRVGEAGAPIIGNRVDIGAGAKILGAITIGNDVHIGANAVVLNDVPDNCTAVGVPALIKRRRGRPKGIESTPRPADPQDSASRSIPRRESAL